MGITFKSFLAEAKKLPGVEESTSYGTPALKVRGKLMLRLREDGETLALKVGFDNRDMLLLAEPEVFFVTDHYAGYPFVLARLSSLDREAARQLVRMTWEASAPKTLLKGRA